MTVETENIQCPACGAAVRPGASFCFKCGKHFGLAGAQVEETPQPVEVPVSTSVNTGELTETIPNLDIKAAEEEEETVVAAVKAEEPLVKPVDVRAKPQMETAASMRRKPKPPREKIEMVWEEPEGSTNPIFIVGTVVIFVLVFVIVVMVYFLK